MNLLQSLCIAFSMYTKIPVPTVKWREETMKYVMCFFPLAGAVEGVCAYLLGRLLLSCKAGPLLFAAAMTTFPLLFTGGIHMDGFMDTTDALCSHQSREKKLEIMKDPHAGAFAVMGAGVYFLWDMALWSEIKGRYLAVIACGYVLSRALSGLSAVAFPTARENGLLKTFHDRGEKRPVCAVLCLWIFLAACTMLLFDVRCGAVVIACALLTFMGYAFVCVRQFGGTTGDLAGWFLQVCELALLTGIVVGKLTGVL